MNENLCKLIDELDCPRQINKIFSCYLFYYNYYSCNVESYHRISVFKKYVKDNINSFIEILINENSHRLMNVFIGMFIDSDTKMHGFQISTSDFLTYFNPIIEELKLSDPSYAWEKCSEETKEQLKF
jgi:pyoverdine/dityrosine biosynthesis protein Dit1